MESTTLKPVQVVGFCPKGRVGVIAGGKFKIVSLSDVPVVTMEEAVAISSMLALSTLQLSRRCAPPLATAP